jgi:hypothetical protein
VQTESLAAPSWWIGAIPGLESLEPGARVDVLRDAPGASVVTSDWVAHRSIARRQDISAADGDPERPAWRIGNATTAHGDGPRDPDFVTAFTVLEVAPGWQRFGPRGEEVADILRQLRSVTLDVVDGAADLPLPARPYSPYGLKKFIRDRGSRVERLRWRLHPDDHGPVDNVSGAVFRVKWIAFEALDPSWVGQQDDRARGFRTIGDAATLAAEAAVAGEAITQSRRAELSAPWSSLGLSPSPDPWGPYPDRKSRCQAEAFRLVRAELVDPWQVSPRQEPSAGTELTTMFDLPYIDGGEYVGAPSEIPATSRLPAGTRVLVGPSSKSGRTLSIESDGTKSWFQADRAGVFMTLVRPDEPILRDQARSANLLERLSGLGLTASTALLFD